MGLTFTKDKLLCFFLFISVIFPHSLNYSYYNIFALVKYSLLLFVFILGSNKINFGSLFFLLIVILYSIIITIFQNQLEGILLFNIYFTLSLFIFYSINTELKPNFIYLKLIIIFIILGGIIFIFYPNMLTYYYGWNSLDQILIFHNQKKIVSIFGLHSTAAFAYFLCLISILYIKELFSVFMKISLSLILVYFLFSLKSVSSYVSIIFYFIFLFIRFNDRHQIQPINLFIFFILIFIFLFFNIYHIPNLAMTSINNRFQIVEVEYLLNLLFSLGSGFIYIDDYTFDDNGVFDSIIKFSLFGALIIYFIIFKNLSKYFKYRKFFIFFIIYLFIMEFGHSYLSSPVFLPLLYFFILNFNNNEFMVDNRN